MFAYITAETGGINSYGSVTFPYRTCEHKAGSVNTELQADATILQYSCLLCIVQREFSTAAAERCVPTV